MQREGLAASGFLLLRITDLYIYICIYIYEYAYADRKIHYITVPATPNY